MEYLRRAEDDANTIIPTFYTGRGGRGGSAASASAEPEAPSAEGSTKPAAPPSDKALPVIQINNPHNLPIDAPFVS